MKTRARRASDATDDLLWKALADPTRRRILDLLRKRSMTTVELCEHFEQTRFGVMKHLRVLEAAQLVVVRREGRECFHYLNPVPIQSVWERWVKPFEAARAAALLRLKQIAEKSERDP